MKANTDFGNLRIFDVIPFYEEYDIEKVMFHFCDANHGYIRFQINGVTPEKSPYAATRVFTTKKLREIGKTNSGTQPPRPRQLNRGYKRDCIRKFR